LSSQVG
jgi:hypothetical protein